MTTDDAISERATGAFIECLMICETRGEEHLAEHLRPMSAEDLLGLAACAVAHNVGLLRGMAAIDGVETTEIIPLVAQDLWGQHYGLNGTD